MGNNTPDFSLKSTIGGTIGALIGAIIGVIPWVIVMNLGLYVGYLAFLIALGSYIGYSRMKGPKDSAFAKRTIYLMTILAIVSVNFIPAITFLFSEGYAINLQNISIYINLVGGSFWFNGFISLVIGFFGMGRINKKIAAYTYQETNREANQEYSEIQEFVDQEN